MSGKQKSKRHKSQQQLNPDHGWRCKSGYSVVVLNRGAVRFDVPNTWIVSEVEDPGGAHFTMFDRPEPDDDIRFQVSVHVLNPALDFTGVPLDIVLAGALGGEEPDGRRTVSMTDPATVRRPNFEFAWNETLFVDIKENREAYTRAIFALGAGLQVFMTMDYWADDTARALPAWDEIARTLRLGQYIKDPLQGPPVLH